MAKKLLIVDDEFDIIEPLEMLFTEAGYIVESLTKGEETYKKIKEFHPDVVLLDILMSGSDGRTICSTLKADASVKDIPIIMMSAHPTAERDSRGCGADAFIAKPFSIEHLTKVVSQYSR